MAAPSTSVTPAVSRLWILAYVAVLAVGLGGLVLYSNHPRFDDPLHKLGWAMCNFCTLGNLVLARAGRPGEPKGLSLVEAWLVRLGAVTVLLGLLWDVAVGFLPGLPAVQDYATGGGFALVALAVVFSVIRGARMPKTSGRPAALVLD